MSSTPYSLQLVPERGPRLVVLASGALAAATGTLVIAGLALPATGRVMAAAVWLTVSCREIWILGRAFGRFGAIRLFADGEAELACPDGGRVRASLLEGSVVLRRLAWLRFRTEDGERHAELLRRSAGSGKAWRRLQVLSRHLGGAR